MTQRYNNSYASIICILTGIFYDRKSAAPRVITAQRLPVLQDHLGGCECRHLLVTFRKMGDIRSDNKESEASQNHIRNRKVAEA